jgi:hypothetical protein
VIILAVALMAARTHAQQCDDFDPCTTNDMCTAQGCSGTPTSSGSCADFDECTVNERCTAEGCVGDPAPLGTACQGGCGTCQSIFPEPIPGVPDVVLCKPKPGVQGQSCSPGLVDGPNLCLEGSCQVQFDIAVTCFPRQKVCPDTDGNPCNDACNPFTGQCEIGASTCFPGCETCNQQTGACEATNLGGACDDFDPCTPLGHCTMNPVLPNRGICAPGTPGASPTATRAAPTATRTNAPATATRPAATNTPAVATATRTTAPPTATQAPATSTPGSGTSPTLVSTATPSAIGDTPTPGIDGCNGDCNGDSNVTISELILQVSIALGRAEPSRCTAGDGNRDGRIAINELIRSTANALDGCAAAGL